MALPAALSTVLGVFSKSFTNLNTVLNAGVRTTTGTTKSFANGAYTLSKFKAVTDQYGNTTVESSRKTFSAIQIINSFTASIGHLIQTVNLFDPSIFKALELTVRDTKAVIGEIFRPIVVTLIPLIRSLGDTLATMKPAIDPFIRSLQVLIYTGFKGSIQTLQVLNPLIHTFGLFMQATVTPLLLIVEILPGLAAGLWLLAKAAQAVSYVLSALPGAKKYTPTSYESLEKRESTGKAVRHTQRLTAEDLGNKFREGAYGGSNALSAQVENTKALQKLTEQLAALNKQKVDLDKKVYSEDNTGSKSEKQQWRAELATVTQAIDKLTNEIRAARGQGQHL